MKVWKWLLNVYDCILGMGDYFFNNMCVLCEVLLNIQLFM
jgi:hypothetical protein